MTTSDGTLWIHLHDARWGSMRSRYSLGKIRPSIGWVENRFYHKGIKSTDICSIWYAPIKFKILIFLCPIKTVLTNLWAHIVSHSEIRLSPFGLIVMILWLTADMKCRDFHFAVFIYHRRFIIYFIQYEVKV